MGLGFGVGVFFAASFAFSAAWRAFSASRFAFSRAAFAASVSAAFFGSTVAFGLAVGFGVAAALVASGPRTAPTAAGVEVGRVMAEAGERRALDDDNRLRGGRGWRGRRLRSFFFLLFVLHGRFGGLGLFGQALRDHGQLSRDVRRVHGDGLGHRRAARQGRREGRDRLEELRSDAGGGIAHEAGRHIRGALLLVRQPLLQPFDDGLRTGVQPFDRRKLGRRVRQMRPVGARRDERVRLAATLREPLGLGEA
ncbi:MAG: hypothetical protein HYY42_02905, partial [Chloroflexi bacterium]|nr:hypothetical protein [Chloroflexota bacterium]